MTTKASNSVLNLVSPPIDEATFEHATLITGTMLGGSINNTVIGNTVQSSGRFSVAGVNSLANSLVASNSVGTLINANVGAGLVYDPNTNTIKIPGIDATLQYYINPSTGSNSNDGLTALTPWQTLPYAYAYVITHFGAPNVQLNLAHGTYTSPLNGNCFSASVGNWILNGDVFDPEAVILQSNGAFSSSVFANGSANITVQGLMVMSDLGGGIGANTGGFVQIGSGIVFHACGAYHIGSAFGASIKILAGYTIIDGSAVHLLAQGSVIAAGFAGAPVNNVINFNPTFGNFCLSDGLGQIYYNSAYASFIGSATGTRYQSVTNSIIETGGGGANFFPGDVPGSTGTGGIYA